MNNTITKSIFLGLIGVFTFYGVMYSQTIEDRKRFIDPNTRTTNDPRRIPLPPGLEGPDGTLVITGGRIFDGTGADVRDGSVVIERNRIKEILPPGSTNWPRDAKVIDVARKTVMPGLMALHEHMTEITRPLHDGIDVISHEAHLTLMAIEHLRWYIESGITSIRDAAAHGEVPFRLKEAVNQNRIPGPRIFSVGQTTTGTGGHSVEGNYKVMERRRILAETHYDGAIEWRMNVREQFNNGADLIKTTNIYNREEIASAIEEAHALGLKVTSDAHVPYLEWAIEAGLDCVEHIGPDRETDRVIRMMVERGVQSVPTVAAGYLNPANMEVLRKMIAAGIPMGVSLDNGEEIELHPINYIRELKTFVEAGMTITEALLSATKVGAEILDMDDKLGTLEPGKLADILVVDGRPDNDLDDLANTDMVIRDGRVIVKNGRVYTPRHVSPNQGN
jgi:imidazolonepropionase-like amidohydrolase